jgi:hypothetical protein
LEGVNDSIINGLFETLVGINSRCFSAFWTSLAKIGWDHKLFIKFIATYFSCTLFQMSIEEIYHAEIIDDSNMLD